MIRIYFSEVITLEMLDKKLTKLVFKYGQNCFQLFLQK